jgi:hypothetical protein
LTSPNKGVAYCINKEEFMTKTKLRGALLAIALAMPGAAQKAILNDFGTSQTWVGNDTFPRLMADVNGDGRLDIVGFGADGVYVSLWTTTGFAPKTRWIAQFGTNAGSWVNNDVFPRFLADVDGDGAADIVGFASDGVFVALSTKTGFGPLQRRLTAMSGAPNWTSNDATPRFVVDITGDGKPDIVGFGSDGIWVSINQGGGVFGTPVNKGASQFTPAQGWISNDVNPRFIADVNGDGKADIVGFSNAGVIVALGVSLQDMSTFLWHPLAYLASASALSF